MSECFRKIVVEKWLPNYFYTWVNAFFYFLLLIFMSLLCLWHVVISLSLFFIKLHRLATNIIFIILRLFCASMVARFFFFFSYLHHHHGHCYWQWTSSILCISSKHSCLTMNDAIDIFILLNCWFIIFLISWMFMSRYLIKCQSIV